MKRTTRPTRQSATALGKPVVALDIDGTLADYHGWFTQFAEMWTGKAMPDPHDNTGGLKFHQWLGISKSTYRACKLAYRRGGLKRGMPCYAGASELTRHIRKRGAEVWICTTRPYLQLENIDGDTRHWLRRNRIQYDGLLFGHNKYRDLVKFVGRERVLFVVDDLPPLVLQAESLGLYAVLREQPYNLYHDWTGARAADMDGVQEIFDKQLRGFHEQRIAGE